ncbi:MAG TPA: hypothetical protein VFH23_05330 [Jiangellaceae bacterium]|nr:hypothetical protein [Jiangellaceae bacterium]
MATATSTNLRRADGTWQLTVAPQLHQLASNVVDVVGDHPNVLVVAGHFADAVRAT